MAKTELFEMYDKDDLDEIKELEKLTDHELMARILFELNWIREEHSLVNIPVHQKVEQYLDDMEGSKDFLTFNEWQKLQWKQEQNERDSARLEQANLMRKSDSIREDLSRLNTESKKNIISKITNYAKTHQDWMLSSKDERIEFFRQEQFLFKNYKLWDVWILKSINDAKFELAKLPKAIISSIIEPIYRKQKIKKD